MRPFLWLALSDDEVTTTKSSFISEPRNQEQGPVVLGYL